MHPSTPKMWADAAVTGIILPKARDRARQELLDHILDHEEALIAAGFSREEAQRQAVTAMGDADETAKLLRQAHQPVLTRMLQIFRWTALMLAAAVVLQLAVSLFETHNLPERLWCIDPVNLYGYDYFQTHELPEGITARRVADAEGSVDLGDYFLTALKVSLDKTEEGTRVAFLLEMKADKLWEGAPLLKGTMTVSCGGETYVQKTWNQSHYRRLRRHYHYVTARFPDDLLKENEIILSFTNGEREFDLPITLEGGDWYAQ